MVKQIVTLLTTFAILVSTTPAPAQQVGEVYRIGFLTTGAPVGFKARLAALRDGLRELGYVEGKNIIIDDGFVTLIERDTWKSRRWTCLKLELSHVAMLASPQCGTACGVFARSGGVED